MSETYDIGVLGMAVMGRNLAMNMADRGQKVLVWNRNPDVRKEAVDQSKGRLAAAETIEDFCKKLSSPRKIVLMIQAGKAVDMVLEQLRSHLDEGDIIIDGGNSWFKDTQRREKEMSQHKLNFFGMGVSGGEEGARFGPSLMPGGNQDAYESVRPILEGIAAKTDSGPCVTHVGPDGAGHFVKMVHNGIEYADMQVIAEGYDFMRKALGMTSEQIGQSFQRWNQGPMESFLIEITGKVFQVADDKTGKPLVEVVLDKAGQKGTGQWTAQIALELGVSVPSIAAALDARGMSADKARRLKASEIINGPPTTDKANVSLEELHDALFAAKIVAYAQGMDLIRKASTEYNWGIDLGEMARIWKGGCIIRARFLNSMMQAFSRNPHLENLLFDSGIESIVNSVQGAWRKALASAQIHGVPMPAMSASLSYFDSLRSADLPQNLTQAQRDAFGAHTYQRVDASEEEFFHTEWLR
jgi:6-phosphogluconate dehydrogenase